MQDQAYEGFINRTAENISLYLAPFIGQLDTSYTWGENTVNHSFVKEHIDFDFNSLSSNYEKTVELKRLLKKLINNSDSFDKRYVIGEFFVKEWGGVRTNADLKGLLAKYDALNTPYGIETLDNVSSWSKYLSLIFEDAYIYDSRVAFAINTINYFSGTTDYFFPTPSGRSSRLGLINIETLFVLDKLKNSKVFLDRKAFKHKRMSSIVRKELYLPVSITYDVYLDLLKQVEIRMKLDKGDAYKIEMLLFCLAPEQILESLINYIR